MCLSASRVGWAKVGLAGFLAALEAHFFRAFDLSYLAVMHDYLDDPVGEVFHFGAYDIKPV